MNRVLISVLSAIALWPAVAAHGVEIGKPFEISKNYLPGDRYMGATLLGALNLSKESVSGLAARELSALAWDEDDGILYAVSDSGTLLHLTVRIEGDRLVGAALAAAFRLRGEDGEPLPAKLADAEGMAIVDGNNGVAGDATLLISFEGEPRIYDYTTDGRFLAARPLPQRLALAENYTEVNEELEGLALHPEYGVITAPQRPLKDADDRYLQLYDLAGNSWSLTPIDPKHSAIVALETTPDGNLLVLERRYVSFFRPVIFAIRALNLGAQDTQTLDAPELVRFDSAMGWRIDNFEGLAWHRSSRYFVVSDDNRNAIQKTLLLYLDLDTGLELDAGDTAPLADDAPEDTAPVPSPETGERSPGTAG